MSEDYTTTFVVDQPPEQVFAAVNDIRGWWAQDVDGPTDQLGVEFTMRYEDHHRSRIRVTELVPDERVAWLVLDTYMDFVQDQGEWTGTRMTFDISKVDGGTQLRFSHLGLVPAYECFDVCSNAWRIFINDSLRSLIVTGTGQPMPMKADRQAS